MIHDYYRQSGAGGENLSFEAEARLLRERGHPVLAYTRRNDEIKTEGLRRKAGLALETVWSARTLRELAGVLAGFRPDVAHVQNFFPLISPSVYYVLKTQNVPVVQTLRNYRLLCPAATLFRAGRVCEDCLGRVLPWPALTHRCYRGSLGATGATAAMLTVHRLLGTWECQVDLYITPSEFARQVFIRAGFPAEKIAVKPNFVDPDPGPGDHRGNFVLYAGRLAPEKGVGTLLSAWRILGGRVPLKLAGDGPLREAVLRAAAEDPAVEWLGSRPAPEVLELMGEARLLVFPSEWYETFGRVVVEAFARGTPVVAADLGAGAELVRGGETGLLFRPGDPEDLAEKVAWAWTHPQALAELGRAGRTEYEAKYTAERNYQRLMQIYETVFQRSKPSR